VIRFKKQTAADAALAEADRNPFDQVRDAAVEQPDLLSMKDVRPRPRSAKTDDTPSS
jgi:hypothetical protein